MLGKISDIGGTISAKLLNQTASLTQSNKVATAQAAAYQQKLSQLQATSTVLGDKTFPKLEKATKELGFADGKAKVTREGKHVTVIAWGAMWHEADQAAREAAALGFEVLAHEGKGELPRHQLVIGETLPGR